MIKLIFDPARCFAYLWIRMLFTLMFNHLAAFNFWELVYVKSTLSSLNLKFSISILLIWMTLRSPLSYVKSGVIGEDLSSIMVHISALCMQDDEVYLKVTNHIRKSDIGNFCYMYKKRFVNLLHMFRCWLAYLMSYTG